MSSARLVDDVEVEVHVLRLVGDLERRAVPYAAAGQRRQRRRQVRRVLCDLIGRTSVRAALIFIWPWQHDSHKGREPLAVAKN